MDGHKKDFYRITVACFAWLPTTQRTNLTPIVTLTPNTQLLSRPQARPAPVIARSPSDEAISAYTHPNTSRLPTTQCTNPIAIVTLTPIRGWGQAASSASP